MSRFKRVSQAPPPTPINCNELWASMNRQLSDIQALSNKICSAPPPYEEVWCQKMRDALAFYWSKFGKSFSIYFNKCGDHPQHSGGYVVRQDFIRAWTIAKDCLDKKCPIKTPPRGGF